MKIFVLEDDYNCNGIIHWLRDKSDTIQIAKNIEDAFYYLEYEDICRYYDNLFWTHHFLERRFFILMALKRNIMVP